ncbi:MAG: glycerol-3-phosphate dehydrogenase/oxidase [Deltaproteobacteria bacterium]|nr:glycerol-3-phosphate dehydrogenase/oxidase [Deltaproteobacteria bacterium]
MQLESVDKRFDLIVIGGGITGAGILREAVRLGHKALLVEQNDFAWGTSSRSSKLVHGGLRYLKEGRFLLTRSSVKERELLLRQAPGLVEPLAFWVPSYRDFGPPKYALSIGLSVYSFLAGKKQHAFFGADEIVARMPNIRLERLAGGFRYLDAQVDDARLVQRLINESVADGAVALNYTAVNEIMRTERGRTEGVTVTDRETGATREISSGLVINATGAWAEKLHSSPDPGLHLRPLRGSHLVFPFDTLPLKGAVSFPHPVDRRPIFAVPWEGVVIVGTTDVDHEGDLSSDPVISKEEVAYLTEGLRTFFPSIEISSEDAVSALSGIRPVFSRGRRRAPSKESREHVVWVDQGLVTVTGGKLTTFRKIAHDALTAARPFLPSSPKISADAPTFSPVPEQPAAMRDISPKKWRRLAGRYGEMASTLIGMSSIGDLEEIPGTRTLWAELPFAAKHEHVRHLTDLLLRRVRIGLLAPHGGRDHLSRIQRLVEPVLSWDSARWEQEKTDYLEHWRRCYAPPKEGE